MPWRILVIVAFVGVAGGGIFGLVRGLSYLPTLPFAIVEGATLFSVPAALLGLVLVAAWSIRSCDAPEHCVAEAGVKGVFVAAQARGQGGSALRLSCIATEVVSTAVIIATTLALPWASYRIGRSPVVPLQVDGALAAVLVSVAALAIVFAVVQIRWRAMALAGVELVLAPVALVLCVVAAAGRISHANSIVDRVTAATATAFGVGSILAVLAGLALVSAAVVVLMLDSPGRGERESERPVLVRSTPPGQA